MRRLRQGPWDTVTVTDQGAGAGDASASTSARRRLRAIWVVALVAMIALVYGLVISLYASSGTVSDAVSDDFDTGEGVLFRIEPQAVEATAGRITVNLDLEEAAGFAAEDGISVERTLYLLVSGAAGSRTIEFAAGSVPSPVSVDLIADGVIERWPFDVHTAETIFLAYYDNEGERTPLETYIVATGRVPGWNISIAEVATGGVVEFDGQPEPVFAVELTATRSGSTIAFGAVLLGLMIVMPVLVLSVAIAVYRGRRRVEASFMSWMGAMLFATIPLRTFLPGSPPIGSWIDFLIVLWVIVGLIGGLAIYVAAWFRWSPRQDNPAAASVGVTLEERVDLGVVHAGEGAAGER